MDATIHDLQSAWWGVSPKSNLLLNEWVKSVQDGGMQSRAVLLVHVFYCSYDQSPLSTTRCSLMTSEGIAELLMDGKSTCSQARYFQAIFCHMLHGHQEVQELDWGCMAPSLVKPSFLEGRDTYDAPNPRRLFWCGWRDASPQWLHPN